MPFIEPLESRIAPAAVTVVGKTASWLDWDGDLVTVKWTGATAPDFTRNHAPDPVNHPLNVVMDEIDFTNAGDAISISVKAAPTGDGRVDLGYINARLAGLNSFTAPKASVSEFDCGDGTRGIGMLVLGSYGTVEPILFTPAAATDGVGVLAGAVGTVKITGDVAYGKIQFGTPATKVGSVTIGGSLLGTMATGKLNDTGDLFFLGPVTSVKIGHSIVGGAFDQTGSVAFGSSFGSLTVGGDILGGGGKQSGRISSATMTTGMGVVSVGGSVLGGSGDESGAILLKIPVKSVTIDGSVAGGKGTSSGTMELDSSFGSIRIGGDIRGGTGVSSGQVFSLNVPVAAGVFSLGGSLLGSSGDGSGAVNLIEPLKSVTIGGSIVGGTNYNTGELLVQKTTASITVGGSVIGSSSSGPNPACGVIFASADVGSIHIGHDLVALAGAANTAGNNWYDGAILVHGNLGSLTIDGSIHGSSTDRALVLVRGTTPAVPGSFNAIGKVTVHGSVDFAVILSGNSGLLDGYVPGGANLYNALNPDAGIGSVTIDGDFLHTSIMAGTNDLDKIGAGRLNGTTTSDTQFKGDPTRHAILGPVTIKGAILDDTSASGDSGFEAEQITKITAGGTTVFKHGDAVRFLDFSHFVFAAELPTV